MEVNMGEVTAENHFPPNEDYIGSTWLQWHSGWIIIKVSTIM